MRRADSLEKTLMLGKTEGRRRRGWQRMRWLDSITNSMDMNLLSSIILLHVREWRTGMLQSKMLQRAGHNLATEWHQQYAREIFTHHVSLRNLMFFLKKIFRSLFFRLFSHCWLGQRLQMNGESKQAGKFSLYHDKSHLDSWQIMFMYELLFKEQVEIVTWRNSKG